MRLLRPFRTLVLALLLPAATLGAGRADTDRAAQLLAHGEADHALALLTQQLVQNAADAGALNLECRVYYAEQRPDLAEAACERAVSLAPANGSYHLWLGRVLGLQAEHAQLLAAYSLAKRVHVEFEAAHQSDPRSEAAASNLGEFYVQAPRLLGGGTAKAKALATAVEPWAPALAHSIRAQIAAGDKDDATAERELEAAAASEGARAQEMVALASFYRNHGRVPDMLAAIDKAVAMDTQHDDALVSAAEQLTRSGQRPEQAISLLRLYLASGNQSEEAPAFRVHARLASLLAKAGEASAAEAEQASARSLASGWHAQAGVHRHG